MRGPIRRNITLANLRAQNVAQAMRDALGTSLQSHLSHRGRGTQEAQTDRADRHDNSQHYRRVDVLINSRLRFSLE
jgi:flagellar motor protein MotB